MKFKLIDERLKIPDIVNIWKEKSRKLGKRKKTKKISKEQFIIDLWNGRSPIKTMEEPTAPIRSTEVIAKKMMWADKKGYFKVRTTSERKRNLYKYILDVNWLLSQLAKQKKIDRKYKPRVKKDEIEN